MKRYRRLWFWLWLVTGAALVASISGWPPGLGLAVAFTMVQVVHQVLRTESVGAMPVQVRYLFLAVMLLGAASPALHVLHALLVVGIAVRLGLNYCVASRLLWLAPWNRREPLTWGTLRAELLPSAPQA